MRTTASAIAAQPDDVLVSLAAGGDRDSFNELLRRHDPAMRRLAYRLLTDAHTMDDALQDAYVKAYRALPGFDARAAFSSWLYRVVHNACIDEIRRSRRRPAPIDPTDETAHDRPGPENVVTDTDTVRRALAALPVGQRSALTLVEGEGLDHRAAARILGIAPGTVASRVSRARVAFRRAVKEDE